MREIKFRGKRIDTGEWVYGFYYEKPSGKSYIYNNQTRLHHKVDPATVGQYTGLRDKKGEEIYKGDISELLEVDMSNEIEHEYTDMIVCPWCGHSDRDGWKTEPGLWECDNCKKSYYVERNEEVTYSTQKANYGTCEHCGKEDVPVEGLISHIGMYDSLCPDCGDKEWRRLLKEY